MADKIDFDIKGLKELERKLLFLKDKPRGGVLRSAVKYAMQPVLDQARATIPVGTESHPVWIKRKNPDFVSPPGFAKSELKMVTRTSKDKNSASALVGVGRLAFYVLQFVELGTSKQRRQPFLIPAMKDNAGEATERFSNKIRQLIDRIAK